MFPTSVSLQPTGTGALNTVAPSADGVASVNGGPAGAFEAVLQQQIGGVTGGESMAADGSSLMQLLAGKSWGGDPALLAELLGLTGDQAAAMAEDQQQLVAGLSGAELAAVMAQQVVNPATVQSAVKLDTASEQHPAVKQALQMAEQLLATLEKGPAVMQNMIAADEELKQLLVKVQSLNVQGAGVEQAGESSLLQPGKQAVSEAVVEMPAEEMKELLRQLIDRLKNGGGTEAVEGQLKSFIQTAQPLVKIIASAEVIPAQTDLTLASEQKQEVSGNIQAAAVTASKEGQTKQDGSGGQSQNKEQVLQMNKSNAGEQKVVPGHYHPLMHLQPPVHTLNTVSQPVQMIPVQQFAADMNGYIIRNLNVIRGEGVHEAVFKLFPENLGQVDVSIKFQNGNIVAQFMAETLQGKEMLENQLNQLKGSLQQQGINVEKLEVSQQQQMNDTAGKEHQRRQPNSGQEQQNRNGRQDGLMELEGLDGPVMLDRGANDLAQQQRLQWMRKMPFGAAVNIQA